MVIIRREKPKVDKRLNPFLPFLGQLTEGKEAEGDRWPGGKEKERVSSTACD